MMPPDPDRGPGSSAEASDADADAGPPVVLPAILVVCRGNICRSPMTVALVEAEARRRGLEVRASSAGFWVDGEPASGAAVRVMAERGLDISDHRSRVVTPELVRSHELVVAVERELARRVVTLVDEPDTVTRVHTLGGLVAGLEALDDATRRRTAGDPTARAAAVARRRPTADLLGQGPDEVPDPHGRSLAVHRRTAERLAALAAGLIEGLTRP
ncbi:MAG: hypothetical protein D6683_05715 [Actinomyces sp.]|nr:MAG: hypothetical protein D6683_05715 [Actinomyces sp.]